MPAYTHFIFGWYLQTLVIRSSGYKNKNMIEIVNVKDRLPNVEYGSYLVYAPESFPKNSRWLVAEYYDDVKGFYSESSENFLEDVTHWCELPKEPNL